MLMTDNLSETKYTETWLNRCSSETKDYNYSHRKRQDTRNKEISLFQFENGESQAINFSAQVFDCTDRV